MLPVCQEVKNRVERMAHVLECLPTANWRHSVQNPSLKEKTV
jgi:hypothetical protein